METNCPFCHAPIQWEATHQKHYVCGAHSYNSGVLRRKGDACDYIGGLHRDVEKLLKQLKGELRAMLAEQLPEWVQR